MSLLDKVRVLVGALVHKPFMPKPEKADLEGEPHPTDGEVVPQDRSALDMQELPVTDTERVADLITQQQREGMDYSSL